MLVVIFILAFYDNRDRKLLYRREVRKKVKQDIYEHFLMIRLSGEPIGPGHVPVTLLMRLLSEFGGKRLLRGRHDWACWLAYSPGWHVDSGPSWDARKTTWGCPGSRAAKMGLFPTCSVTAPKGIRMRTAALGWLIVVFLLGSGSEEAGSVSPSAEQSPAASRT